jgi:subtilisin family serine protease
MGQSNWGLTALTAIQTLANISGLVMEVVSLGLVSPGNIDLTNLYPAQDANKGYCDAVGGVREGGSSFGFHGSHQTLTAPSNGIKVYNGERSTQFSEEDGTSYSAPMAAGTASLLWSVNPDLYNDDIYNILHKTAIDTMIPAVDNGRNDEWGYGILNAYNAIEYATSNCISHHWITSLTNLPYNGIIPEATISYFYIPNGSTMAKF